MYITPRRQTGILKWGTTMSIPRSYKKTIRRGTVLELKNLSIREIDLASDHKMMNAHTPEDNSLAGAV
jgi:hypothetical protein